MNGDTHPTRMSEADRAERDRTRQGLQQAIALQAEQLPENVLRTLWKLLSYPPAQLRRAQLMIVNCAQSADLFYDAIRVDRIVRYLDSKTEEGLLVQAQSEQAKRDVKEAIQELRGRIGMATTILRSRLGEVAQSYKVSFRGLSRLGAYEKVYERSGQKLFSKGGPNGEVKVSSEEAGA